MKHSAVVVLDMDLRTLWYEGSLSLALKASNNLRKSNIVRFYVPMGATQHRSAWITRQNCLF